MPNNPTNQDLYNIVDAVRLELKGDIQTMSVSLSNSQGRLEKKFDDLEAGRLTAVETGLATVKARMGVQENNRVRWWNYLIPAILYILGQLLLYLIITKSR